MNTNSKMPSAKTLVPIVLSCMFAFLALAFVADCVRLDGVSRSHVNRADEELLSFEQSLIQTLTAQTSLSPETDAALDTYSLTKAPAERHKAFQSICKSVSEHDAHLLTTGINDRLRGIENRWSIAYQAYESGVAIQQNYRKTLRGRVAAWVWGN